MDSVSVIALVAALLALAVAAFSYLSVQRNQGTIDQLRNMHAPSRERQMTELSAPPAISFAGERSHQPQEAVEPPLIPPAAPPLTDFERLIVLGFRTQIIAFDNQPDGKNMALKDVTVEIPEGTTQVVASVQGFLLLFGELTALSEGSFVPRFLDDHHLALEVVHVRVTEIGRVTATLHAQMLLRDDNGDDRWAGVMDVLLVFFGPPPNQLTPVNSG